MQNHLSAKLLAEFIGTFAFVFIGAGAAAVIGTGAGLAGIAAIAFAHGLTIMVFAFAYGSVSGAHFNPAVTVGAWAARAISRGEAVAYVFAQLVAGACAALLLRAVLGGARHRAWPARTRSGPSSRRNDSHDHASGWIRDRGRARFLPRHRRARDCSRGQRRRSRAARDRDDSGLEHHDGRRIDRGQLQSCNLFGSDDRDRQLYQRMALCHGADLRRHCRGVGPQNVQIAGGGRDGGAARDRRGRMITSRPGWVRSRVTLCS